MHKYDEVVTPHFLSCEIHLLLIAAAQFPHQETNYIIQCTHYKLKIIYISASTELNILSPFTSPLSGPLSCIHNSLQCRTCRWLDVLITYLPKLQCTAPNQDHFLAVLQYSSRRKDGNMTTATYHNTDAVEYEWTFC